MLRFDFDIFSIGPISISSPVAASTARRSLPAPLCAALHKLSRAERCTLFMTLLTAFEVVLGKHSGQSDFCVGAPIAGRDRAELEDLRAVKQSLMPEGILKPFSDQQVRDLFAYLRSTQPLP